MDAAQFLPTEPSSEVTQIHEGDYKDADGLWHCGVCGKARQKKINSPYFHKTVWCICDCRARELEERRRKEEYEEEMHRVQRLKDASMMASKFRDAEFSVYQKRKENQRAYDVSRKYVAQFRQMITEGNPKTGERNIGLVFYGPCGTGKSFTAACIANELIEQNISVVMTSFVKILQDIQGQDEAAYIGMLNACSLLSTLICHEKMMERGLTRNPANPTPATYYVSFVGMVPEMDSKMSVDDYFFTLSSDSEGRYILISEDMGTDMNNLVSGTKVIPELDVDGLISATLGELAIPAIDAESDDSARERLINRISGPDENGNKSQVRTWCESVEGVGAARIIPLWKGPYTVVALFL